ncbi:MAG: hypothetical protein U5N55_10780 [Cypionkella sp.]|nr:hypothetical protein [Cypionkella sp.]
MKQARVNIRSLANSKAARREKRNGRDLLIVPSATLPDDVVMNGILYPADEIAKSFLGLNRTPAPLGHPTINGQFVSASDPEGINIGYIGAWNENVRRENGRVFLDKVIDVEVANRTHGGREVLAAIENGQPVHTSTGLYLELEDAPADAPYNRIGRNMSFDHDAILLDQPGAATPEQGVGMMVNGVQMEVINSALDDAERQLDWAGVYLMEAVERTKSAAAWEKIKGAIMGFLASEPTKTENETRKETDMTAEQDKQLADLSAKVNALSDIVEKQDVAAVVANAIAEALKPMAEQLAAIQNAEKAKADAEKISLVERIVNAGLLEKADADAASLPVLNALAAKIKPPMAFGLNGAFGGDVVKDEFFDTDLNADIKAAMGVK